MKPFPGSTKCKRPKMKNHRGRTWDMCDVIDMQGNKIVGYLDTSWGEYVYFQTPDGWRKVNHNNFPFENSELDFRNKNK